MHPSTYTIHQWKATGDTHAESSDTLFIMIIVVTIRLPTVFTFKGDPHRHASSSSSSSSSSFLLPPSSLSYFLWLSNNAGSHFHANQLVGLRVLRLHNNRLKTVQETTLEALKDLTWLELHSNDLASLPSSISLLSGQWHDQEHPNSNLPRASKWQLNPTSKWQLNPSLFQSEGANGVKIVARVQTFSRKSC